MKLVSVKKQVDFRRKYVMGSPYNRIERMVDRHLFGIFVNAALDLRYIIISESKNHVAN